MAGTSNQNDSSSFWDVFLSFRGEDTRKNFTGHLYAALVQVGILTFKDDPELETGEEISSELIKTIRNSKMSIVVFSKNYASSRWCLDELVEIMDCKKNGQTVLPIFYDVEPSNVRHQTGSFAEAFERHKKHSRADMDKVKKWQAALAEAAGLSGYDLKHDANGHEADLVQKTVKFALLKVCPKDLNLPEHLVGIDSHVKNIYPKLSIGSNDVRFIGIFGMTGIGKTTIVKALYNNIYKEFEGSCFLENVREALEEPHGLLYLLEQLIFQLLKIKNFKVTSVDRGISLVKQTLGKKRVLVVLDDVDQLSQLKSLAGHWNWFGSGSRIIITTRDACLLDRLGVDLRYEVKELNKCESLELFTWHAFRNTIPTNDFMDLSKDIVSYIGGLPLALEVLGSNLLQKTMVEWKSVFEKLQQIPNDQIQKILRISYDTLEDDTVQDIFLDIACFFIGMDQDDANYILDGCGFFPVIGISILRGRSLLKIDEKNKLRMHNLIRDMGREIVREESVKNPTKRSRLWCHKDAYNVLKNFKGHKNIEGIRLVMPMQEEVDISTRAFHSLPNLRLLQIHNVNLIGSFENLFEGLRWLCWYYSSLDCLPSSFQPQKLIFLDMQHSKLKILWEGTKQLQSLKILNASGSHFLKTTPDFEGLEWLEKLMLQRCSSLSQIHPSIGLLHKLVNLDLCGCESLNQLPEQLQNLGCLRKLDVTGSSIEQLPDSIGHLGKLKELYLGWCKNLRNLPSSICDLTSLRLLILGNCSNLESLPKNMGNLTSLKYLDVCGANIIQLPNSIGCLTRLEHLAIYGCKRLRNTPRSIYNLSSLETLDLRDWSDGGDKRLSNPSQLVNFKKLSVSNCSSLQSRPELPPNLEKLSARDCTSPDLSRMNNLIRLDFTRCISLQSLPQLPLNLEMLSARGCTSLDKLTNLSRMNNLTRLDFTRCISLLSLPKLPLNLEVLSAHGCTSMDKLPNLSRMNNLTRLDFSRCSSLQSLPELPPNLEELSTGGCSSLDKLPNLSRMNNLIRLDFEECSSLQSLPKLPPNLEELSAGGCTSLDKLPNLSRMNNLIRLDFDRCSSLQSLPKLPLNLEKLSAGGCTSLDKLPNLSRMNNLIRLYFSGCSSLQSLPELPPNLEVLFARGCTSLDKLPNLSRMNYLIKLDFTKCSSLRSLPKLPCKYIDLDLTDCSSLESLQELPCDLYSLNASGCKSLQKLPDLSNLTKLRRIILTDCSNLRSNFIWSFLQDFSGLDGCDVYLPSRVIQDRFRHQRKSSSTSFQVPREVKSNFLRMAFWVVFGGKLHSHIEAVITNETDGTQFKYMGTVQTTRVHSWVRSIGKPISMKSGDKIEVSFKGTENVTVEMCGVHLDCKRVRDVDVAEPLCPFKRSKHSA